MAINQNKFLEEVSKLKNEIKHGKSNHPYHIFFPFLSDLNPSIQEVYDACILAHGLFSRKI